MQLNEKVPQKTVSIAERDKKILQDDIQRIYNRIEYDRNLDDDGKFALQIQLQEKEAEYKKFFGEGTV